MVVVDTLAAVVEISQVMVPELGGSERRPGDTGNHNI